MTRQPAILTAVRHFISRHELIPPGGHILAAVSGGVDSVVLLHLLHRLANRGSFRLTVAHLNHGLRGRAAEEDARFVRRFARRLGRRCLTGAARVSQEAQRKKISLEMAAREARYRFLARAARVCGADAVAIAHTADDQAETVLLKLARGAGAQGLGGMAPITARGNLRIIRPLLECWRADILAYARHERLDWREDASNRDSTFLRNRVRQEVLPFLEQRLNPRLRDALRRTAGILRADNDWLEALARDVLRQTSVGRGALDIKKLSVFPLAARRRALRLWLVAGGLPPDAIDFDLINRIEILLGQEQGSQSLNLPRDRRVRRSYALLTLEKTPTARRTRATTAVAVRVPGVTVWPTAGLRVLVAVRPGLIRERPREPGHVPSSASLGRVVTGGLALRFCRPGDRLRPLGLHGSKKIQDILVDAKVPRDRRATIPVLAYRGAIVWLPGYRIAEGWQVRDASRPALHIRLRPAGRAPTVPAR